MKRTIKLSFSKEEVKRASLAMGNAGIMIAMPSKEADAKKFMHSFGWGSSSDSNKFYPDLNVKKDLAPKEEDFVNVPFRLLSATMVAAGTWRSTDFSDASVLKDAVKKLDGKPVYKDHETDLDNWVGIVRNPKFSGAFTMDDGTQIPAGLDGIISIDGKTNPKIARGVLLGAIFSNSVTVEFDWIPSHEFENDYQFENALGTIIDGKMVCRKVTRIIDFYESSLVWLGADPYAKMIDENGNLVNVDESSTYEEESEVVKTKYQKDKKYEVKFGFDKNLLSLAKSNSQSLTQKNTKKMNDKVLEALRKKLKLADDVELTDAHAEAVEKLLTDEEAAAKAKETSEDVETVSNAEVTEAVAEITGEVVEETTSVKDALAKLKGLKGIKVEEFTKLSENASKVASLETEKVTLTGELANLKVDKATLEAKVIELGANAKLGEKFMSDKRAEVIRLYTLAVDNKPVDAVLSLMQNAKLEELEGLLSQYTKGNTEKFSGKCKSCGSTEFEFKSTVGGDDETSTEDVIEVSGMSFQDLAAKFSNTSMNLTANK